MWPWEHAAVGYLLYSLGLRTLGRRPPSDDDAIVLLVGTQLPDLVDKPLSWGFEVFPSGYAMAHSVFVAVPAGLLALIVAARAGRRRVGVAFTVGYWSHLAADVLVLFRQGRSPSIERVLWPMAESAPYETDHGLRRGLVYLGDFVADLAAMDATSVLLLYVLLPLTTLAVWLFDSTPGLATITRALDAVRRA